MERMFEMLVALRGDSANKQSMLRAVSATIVLFASTEMAFAALAAGMFSVLRTEDISMNWVFLLLVHAFRFYLAVNVVEKVMFEKTSRDGIFPPALRSVGCVPLYFYYTATIAGFCDVLLIFQQLWTGIPLGICSALVIAVTFFAHSGLRCAHKAESESLVY